MSGWSKRDLSKMAALFGFVLGSLGLKFGMLLLYYEVTKLVELEVVLISPNWIKSLVLVYCGFSFLKMVFVVGFAPVLVTFLTSCLFCWTMRAKKYKKGKFQIMMVMRQPKLRLYKDR